MIHLHEFKRNDIVSDYWKYVMLCIRLDFRNNDTMYLKNERVRYTSNYGDDYDIIEQWGQMEVDSYYQKGQKYSLEQFDPSWLEIRT